MANKLIPNLDPTHKKSQKVDDMLSTIENAFESDNDATTAATTNADANEDAGEVTSASTASTNKRTNKRMIITFICITLAYSGEMIGAVFSPDLPKWNNLHQYHIGICTVLFVFFCAAANAAYNQFINVFRRFVQKVVNLSTTEIKRQEHIVQRAKETDALHTLRVNAQNGKEEENQEEEKQGTSLIDNEIQLEEISLEEHTTSSNVSSTTSCCSKIKRCIWSLTCQHTDNGMTSNQAFRFWCCSETGTRLFWCTSTIAWICCILLGLYITIITTVTTPLVLSIGLPVYHFFFLVAYLRWSKINDFDFDWIVGLWSLAALIVLLLISGTIWQTESKTYSSLGFTIGAGILVITTTGIGFINWFNTLEKSKTLYFTSVLSGSTLIIWSVMYWQFVRHGLVDISALVILFVLLGYPTIVLLLLAFFLLKDNLYVFTKIVYILFAVSLSFIFVFFAAVCWVDVTIGLILVSLFTLLLSSVLLVGMWMKNGYVATRVHKICFLAALFVLGGLGLGAGYNEKSFLIGFTIFWISLILLSIGYYLYTTCGPSKKEWTERHYDNVLCYPVYSLDRSNLTLIQSNGPSAAASITCGLLIVWGVVYSSSGKNGTEWIGLGVLSIALAWGVAINYHFRYATNERYRNVQHHITYHMLESNRIRSEIISKKQIQHLVLMPTFIKQEEKDLDGTATKTIEINENEEEEEYETIESIVEQLQDIEKETQYKYYYSHASTPASLRTETQEQKEAIQKARKSQIDIENQLLHPSSISNNDEMNTLEKALNQMNVLHAKLCTLRIVQGRQTAAYQSLTISSAIARKETREALLREVMHDLNEVLQIDLSQLNDLKAQQELCFKIRTYLKDRKEAEIAELQAEEDLRIQEELREAARQKQLKDAELRKKQMQEKKDLLKQQEKERQEIERQRIAKAKEDARVAAETEQKRRAAEAAAIVAAATLKEQERLKQEARERKKEVEAKVKRQRAEQERLKQLAITRRKDLEAKRKQQEENETKENGSNTNTIGTRAWCEQIYQTVINGNDKFTDTEWDISKNFNVRTGNGNKSVSKWIRAGDYNLGPGQPILYKDNLNPKDISQGSSGTCYLLAGLAAMAECRPDLIKRCFLKHNVDKGIYMIKFYGGIYQGEKECVVLLDDYVPLGKWSGGSAAKHLAFLRPDGYGANQQMRTSPKIDMELWALLLEAAYCKINNAPLSKSDLKKGAIDNELPVGTYQGNYGGYAHKAIMQLTGMNGISMRSSDALWTCDDMWDRLSQIGHGVDIACAGTPAMENNNKGHHGLTKKGLSPTHAYAILGTANVDSVRLVCMMNPWGGKKGEWTGDWSDDSILWTKRMKKKIPMFQKGEDGIFWLTIEDWVINFRSFYWCSDEKFVGHSKCDLELVVGMNIIACSDFNRSRSGSKVLQGTKGVIYSIDGKGNCVCTFEGHDQRKWAFPSRGDILPDQSTDQQHSCRYCKKLIQSNEEIFKSTKGKYSHNKCYTLYVKKEKEKEQRRQQKLQQEKERKKKRNNNNNNNNNNNSVWNRSADEQKKQNDKRKKDIQLNEIKKQNSIATLHLKSILNTSNAASSESKCW